LDPEDKIMSDNPNGKLPLPEFFDFEEGFDHILEMLKETKDALQRANQAKSAFLANLSHEIRTPMNAIMGFAQMLQKSDLNESQQDYVNVILESGYRLQSFINDLLDLANYELGKVSINATECRVDECVGDIWNEFLPRIREKHLLPHAVCPAQENLVLIDRQVLRRILESLLDNALKFTSTGSISLECAYQPLGEDKLEIMLFVTDTGIGISADRLPGIFNAFEQADSGVSRRHGGTGLGLGLCKRMVNHLGGTISVTSEPGIGSRFTVRLPLQLVQVQ
jgi:signal transduction histidine kinase